jgi:hypothetical protein
MHKLSLNRAPHSRSQTFIFQSAPKAAPLSKQCINLDLCAVAYALPTPLKRHYFAAGGDQLSLLTVS